MAVSKGGSSEPLLLFVCLKWVCPACARRGGASGAVQPNSGALRTSQANSRSTQGPAGVDAGRPQAKSVCGASQGPPNGAWGRHIFLRSKRFSAPRQSRSWGDFKHTPDSTPLSGPPRSPASHPASAAKPKKRPSLDRPALRGRAVGSRAGLGVLTVSPREDLSWCEKPVLLPACPVVLSPEHVSAADF